MKHGTKKVQKWDRNLLTVAGPEYKSYFWTENKQRTYRNLLFPGQTTKRDAENKETHQSPSLLFRASSDKHLWQQPHSPPGTLSTVTQLMPGSDPERTAGMVVTGGTARGSTCAWILWRRYAANDTLT